MPASAFAPPLFDASAFDCCIAARSAVPLSAVDAQLPAVPRIRMRRCFAYFRDYCGGDVSARIGFFFKKDSVHFKPC